LPGASDASVAPALRRGKRPDHARLAGAITFSDPALSRRRRRRAQLAPSGSPTRTFTFEGLAIAYDTFGEGDPVVLVHGTPFSSFVWRAIARELARSYRVFFYDLLGYGRSEKRAGQDVSLAVQNRLLAALLKHWALDRPHVIAHDFGGPRRCAPISSTAATT